MVLLDPNKLNDFNDDNDKNYFKTNEFNENVDDIRSLKNDQVSSSTLVASDYCNDDSQLNQTIQHNVKSVKEHAKKLNRLSTETALKNSNEVNNKQQSSRTEPNSSKNYTKVHFLFYKISIFIKWLFVKLYLRFLFRVLVK